MTYGVPKNTTLVEVLGPVGIDGEVGDDPQECYARFQPNPFWWSEKRVPVGTSLKHQNRMEQTLFLLPLDPAVQYTLFVGPTNMTMSCRVSHIRSYPFF